MQSKMTVKGVPEVTRAFDEVEAKVSDLSEAHRAEAEMLLPDIVNATRRGKTGDLASGWGTDSTNTEARFINDVEYAGVQEWGWSAHNIEPTHAIVTAFERNASQTEALYADRIENIGDRAGFNTRK